MILSYNTLPISDLTTHVKDNDEDEEAVHGLSKSGVAKLFEWWAIMGSKI